MIVLAYLAAVVAANLTIAAVGPIGAIPVAFLFVGFDLTARDRLHERWRWEGPTGLALRMGAIILAGGALSFLLNRDAGPIAVASTVAFILSASADALVYGFLRERRSTTYYQRINLSNMAGALVDSLVFPTLAFGAFLPAIVLGQFAAKVLGGALWAYVLRPRPKLYRR